MPALQLKPTFQLSFRALPAPSSPALGGNYCSEKRLQLLCICTRRRPEHKCAGMFASIPALQLKPTFQPSCRALFAPSSPALGNYRRDAKRISNNVKAPHKPTKQVVKRVQHLMCSNTKNGSALRRFLGGPGRDNPSQERRTKTRQSRAQLACLACTQSSGFSSQSQTL